MPEERISEEFGKGVHLGEVEGNAGNNDGMKARELEEDEWSDRDEWRRKIIL